MGTGTLGCLVKLNRRGSGSGRLYILSNSHVIADYGGAKIGARVIQPGYIDEGQDPDDAIAELTDFVPFQFTGTGYPNLVDAAIAKVRRRPSVTDKIRVIGITPKVISTNVWRGMTVRKVGRTTDLTCGVVTDIHFHTSMTFKKPGGGTGRVGFKKQVLCTRYTADGDSGSIVLDDRNAVVGLHFAGSATSSIFNRISCVVEALKIKLA